MKIAIDSTPLRSQDKYRGIGNYTNNLINSLKKFDHHNAYLIDEPNNLLDYNLLIIPYFNPFKISLPLYKKYKIILTIHDLIPLKFPKEFPVGIKAMFYWNIQRLLLRNIDYLLTDSEVSKKDIINICQINVSKIAVVYPAISPRFKIIEDRNELLKIKDKYKLPDKFLLYVGDCNWNKNIPLLIKAASELNYKLVLVGKVFTDKTVDLDHPWNKSLNEVNNLTLKNPLITKLGYLSTDELIAVYNLSSIYIQPSYYEGFGLSAVEAMACGSPVIASNTGCLKEVCKDAALYFNPYSKGELILKIKDLMTNGLLRKNLIHKGIEVKKRYTEKNFADSVIKIYEKI